MTYYKSEALGRYKEELIDLAAQLGRSLRDSPRKNKTNDFCNDVLRRATDPDGYPALDPKEIFAEVVRINIDARRAYSESHSGSGEPSPYNMTSVTDTIAIIVAVANEIVNAAMPEDEHVKRRTLTARMTDKVVDFIAFRSGKNIINLAEQDRLGEEIKPFDLRLETDRAVLVAATEVVFSGGVKEYFLKRHSELNDINLDKRLRKLAEDFVSGIIESGGEKIIGTRRGRVPLEESIYEALKEELAKDRPTSAVTADQPAIVDTKKRII
jgi:hypothetical protein